MGTWVDLPYCGMSWWVDDGRVVGVESSARDSCERSERVCGRARAREAPAGFDWGFDWEFDWVFDWGFEFDWASAKDEPEYGQWGLVCRTAPAVLWLLMVVVVLKGMTLLMHESAT